MTTIALSATLVSTQPVSPHGLAGFFCVVTGSPVTFADCLACAQSGRNNGCPLTAPVVDVIMSGIRPRIWPTSWLPNMAPRSAFPSPSYCTAQGGSGLKMIIPGTKSRMACTA